MTIDEFRQWITNKAQARLGLVEYAAYLKQETREDKSLREEYLAILTVIDYKAMPGNQQIDLDNDSNRPDATIGGENFFEVTQALPKKDHEIRHEVASGGADLVTYYRHSADHLQFPQAIINAIEKKHLMRYPESRSLIIVMGGDYSSEKDDIIDGWVQQIRNFTTRGTFREILLVELDRRKVFPLFEAEE
jgi:hypothetical protein